MTARRTIASTAARTSPTRYPLDALRAIAASAVIAYHAYQNNAALPDAFEWTGIARSGVEATALCVDLFFVISGFLLWLPVARAALDGRAAGSGFAMLRRRVLRLLPLYYVVFLFAWCLANPALPGNWQDLLLHLTFTQIYSDTYAFYTVGPAWSLAIEFHFYVLIALAIPIVGFVATRVRSRSARLSSALVLPVALAVVGAGYLYWAIVLSPQPMDAWSVWYSAPSKAAAFAAGMLVAVLAASEVVLARPIRWAATTVALGTVVAYILARPVMHERDVEWFHIAGAVASGLALAAIALNPGSQPRWLSARPLVYVGTVSYSLYLVHELVMHSLRDLGVFPAEGSTWAVGVTAVLVFTFSLLVASLTYRLLEVPGQRLLGLWDSAGRPRDNYEHVVDGQRPAAVPALVGR